MLEAKYYRDLNGIQNCILITGDVQAHQDASAFLRNLSDSDILANQYITWKGSAETARQPITLTKNEWAQLANICKQLSDSKEPVHDYLSIESAPHLELLISCNEYKMLP